MPWVVHSRLAQLLSRGRVNTSRLINQTFFLLKIKSLYSSSCFQPLVAQSYMSGALNLVLPLLCENVRYRLQQSATDITVSFLSFRELCSIATRLEALVDKSSSSMSSLNEYDLDSTSTYKLDVTYHVEGARVYHLIQFRCRTKAKT